MPPAPQGTLIHVSSDAPLPFVLYRVVGTIQGVIPAGRVGPGSVGSLAIGGGLEPLPTIVDTTVNQLVCTAPCDVEVSGPASEFFFGGEEIAPSRHIHLDLRLRRIDIMASPQGMGRIRGGAALLSIGIVASLVGTVLLPLAFNGSDVTERVTVTGIFAGGQALIGASIPLLVTGHTALTVGTPGAELRF